MNVFRTALAAITLVGLSHTAHSMTTPQADALVAHVVAQTAHVGGGVASLPLAGDGVVARSFVNGSRMWVHAMESTQGGVQTVLAQVEPTGQVGLRCWVELGGPSQLPFSDNFVDVVLITGLTDGSLAQVSFDEIMRSLVPTGKAFVGRAAAEGAGLGVTALQGWVNGRSGATVTTDAQGTWAIITKAWPSRRDDWTHTTHGPDNNPVSLDSTIRWPYLPQWRMKPLGCDRYGGVVTAGGRAYMALNQAGATHLRAYREHNGQVLWTAVTDPRASGSNGSAPRGASFMVATANGVWTAQRNRAVLYNGETGAQSSTITFDASATRWIKWLALSDGLLLGLIGDSTADSAYARYGTVVAAFDPSSGAERWRQTLGKIESREIGISSGKLYYYVPGVKVACVDVATGTGGWSQTGANVIGPLQRNTNEDWSWTTFPATGFLCSPQGVFICSPGDSAMIALAASDGHLLWTAAKDFWGRMTPKMIIGTTLLNQFASPADRRCVDITTGATSTRYTGASFGGGCGVRTASPDGVFGNYGGQGSSFALGRSFSDQNFKTDCGIGAILSNGMHIYTVTGCQCSPIRGSSASAAAGSFQFERSAVQSERLQTGPALGAVDARVVPDNSDWWTHRANGRRSGHLDVDLPLSPHLVCSFRPASAYDTTASALGDRPDGAPTPPVMAGALVFWGGTDSYLRCFDTRTAQQVWSYATGGAIRMAPTVWDGCVYAGSEDGWVYCLEAHSGRLVWRFRAAPVERRVNLYGHLASTWPVNSGVTVSGANVIFAAGLLDNYGTHVYSVNARSGALAWQNNTSGSVYVAQDREGVTPCGYGTMVKGTYWQRAQTGRNGIYAASTGAFAALPTTPSLSGPDGGPSTYGSQIGLLDSSHVTYGGRLLYADRDDRMYSDRKRTFMVQRVDAQGNATYPEVAMTINAVCTPAWDNQVYLTNVENGHSSTWIEKWNTGAYISAVDARISSNAGQKEVIVSEPAFADRTPTSLAQWSIMDVAPNAIALARNAAVVLSAGWDGSTRWDKSRWTWHLNILARNSVDTIWTTRLPSEPVHDGVAIGRSGEIIVALVSGAVLCYGTGTVSVAPPTYSQGTVTPSSPGVGWVTPEMHASVPGTPAPTASDARFGTAPAAQNAGSPATVALAEPVTAALRAPGSQRHVPPAPKRSRGRVPTKHHRFTSRAPCSGSNLTHAYR